MRLKSLFTVLTILLLFPATIHSQATSEKLDSVVLYEEGVDISQGYWLVAFWAPWCEQCQSWGEGLYEEVEKLPEVFPYKICLINVEDHQKFFEEKFPAVHSLPSVSLISNGEIIHIYQGDLKFTLQVSLVDVMLGYIDLVESRQ